MINKSADICVVGSKNRKRLGTYKLPTDQEAFEICCGISSVLNMHYPGHLWECGMIQDVVYIKNLRLNKKQAYKINLSEIDVEGKVLMRIGGEILERFSQKVGRMDRSAIEALPKDIRGDAKAQT